MTPRKMNVAVCALLLLNLVGLAQTPGERPRRVRPAAIEDAVASNAAPMVANASRQASLLEALVPREGLFFYVEMRGATLQEMLETGAFAPLAKSMMADKSPGNGPDRLALLTSALSQLPDARLAIASFPGGVVGFIEAASDGQAEQIRAGLERLKTREMSVGAKGGVVFAGTTEACAWVLKTEGRQSIADDSEFNRARQRFSDESIFGYLRFGPRMSALPDNANPSYAAGYLTGLASIPAAIAFGGSREGDTFVIRAMTVDSSRGSDSLGLSSSLSGLLTGLLLHSSQGASQKLADGFAPADADIFLEVLVDWDRLYDAVGLLMSAIGSSVDNRGNATSGSVDLFATFETQLGFSIKNDLIPTLGNEVAISISGFDRFMNARVPARPASVGKSTTARAIPSPRFMLIVALKDPASFEKLFDRLLSRLAGAGPSTVVSRVAYKNTTIVHAKSVAYCISDGFLVVGGTPADIRRALDSRTAGTSLATSDQYRKVIPDTSDGMLHVYVSSSLTSKLIDTLQNETGLRAASRSTVARVSGGPVGLVVKKEGEDTMTELRMPLSLVSSIVAAISSIKPSIVWGETTPGVGIPDGDGTRTSTRRGTPTLTNEDIRRRP
jgi:hypothetical protein